MDDVLGRDDVTNQDRDRKHTKYVGERGAPRPYKAPANDSEKWENTHRGDVLEDRRSAKDVGSLPPVTILTLGLKTNPSDCAESHNLAFTSAILEPQCCPPVLAAVEMPNGLEAAVRIVSQNETRLSMPGKENLPDGRPLDGSRSESSAASPGRGADGASFARIEHVETPAGMLSASQVWMETARVLGLQLVWAFAYAALIFAGIGLTFAGPAHPACLSLTLLGLALLFAQGCVIVTYEWWPLNQLYCARFRRRLASRGDAWVVPHDVHARVVELVPRDRWNKMKLETATDIMLMRMDSDGIVMEGDRRRYAFTPESILSAMPYQTSVPGSFTTLYSAVMYVRTPQGPIEIPLFYRDMDLGQLRSSRRRADRDRLVEAINAIARGNEYQEPETPLIAEVIDEPEESVSNNPYAPPPIRPR
ncbi:MAG: hypothetical protein AAGD07_15395 [Planctomycetota bacterium]